MFSTISSIVILPFVLICITAAGAYAAEIPAASSPLTALSDGDTFLAETGLILFDRAVNRHWSSTGSPQGTMGLLSRASHVYAHIADPAARYYLMAQLELYRGRVTLKVDRRSRARPHFTKSMELAAESASFSETAEAYRVRAEAGYEWMRTRRLRGKSKMGPSIREWLARSLELDSGSTSAGIVQAQFTHHSFDNDEERLLKTLGFLESLESLPDLNFVGRFRSRVLLSQINSDLNRDAAAETWCEKAAEIFPRGTALKDCR